MDRRKFVAGAGGVLINAGAASSALARGKDTLAYPKDSCSTARPSTPGPYVTRENIVRSDIRENSPGIPLHLTLRITDNIWCEAIKGALVDIWQCDALGVYAGFDNIKFDQSTLRITGSQGDFSDKTYLRGRQTCDDDGVVQFTTIFPGWYVPRLPHIHVRVMHPQLEWMMFTTQIYFPIDIEKTVFEQAPYAVRGQNPITVRRDLVVKGDVETLKAHTVALAKDGEGYKGSFVIGI